LKQDVKVLNREAVQSKTHVPESCYRRLKYGQLIELVNWLSKVLRNHNQRERGLEEVPWSHALPTSHVCGRTEYCKSWWKLKRFSEKLGQLEANAKQRESWNSS